MKTAMVSISIGELADKISILEIKLNRITDTQKVGHIRNELSHLRAAELRLFSSEVTDPSSHYSQLCESLRTINEMLWEVEDSIRECESDQCFDEVFINLARSVYRLNDKRFSIKKQINETFDSSICEEKSYSEY